MCRLLSDEIVPVGDDACQTSKFVKIHGSKLLLLRLRAGNKTIFVVAVHFNG